MIWTNPDERAYPSLEFDGGGDMPLRPYTGEYGLTKREEFAKAAMKGILANPHLTHGFKETVIEGLGDGEPDESYTRMFSLVVSSMATNCADALIEALNKEKDTQ